MMKVKICFDKRGKCYVTKNLQTLSNPWLHRSPLSTFGCRETVTIDTITWPYKVLQMRGNAEVSNVNGVAPEYATAARRYFGEEQGDGWVQQAGGLFATMTRIAVKPTWVNILDFEQRFPSAIAKAMADG